MARAALVALLVLVSLAAAYGCATPKGGCRIAVCEKYRRVTSAGIWFPGANYSDPATWRKGWLPYVGYLVGIYNKDVNGGVYNKAGIKDTPGLNRERFDLETNAVDPDTGSPYARASPGGETNLADCCIACANTDGCFLYQFFETKDLPNGGPQCYLLSGGTVKSDFPEHGTPFAGTKTQQTKGDRKNIPMSYVGGRCNGSISITDDPHFVGARGVRFDFNGALEKSFCLTTDKRVQVNALLRGYEDTNTEGATVKGDGKALRTWIRELAFLWKDAADRPHSLHLVARSGKQQKRGKGFVSKAMMDGKKLQLPQIAGEEIKKGYLKMSFLGTVENKNKIEQDKYRVRIGNYLDVTITMRVAHKKMQSPNDAEAHFNLLFNKLKTTDSVHGVLGQTYRNNPEQVAKAVKFTQVNQLLGGPIQADGESGKGFMEGKVEDYITPLVTDSKCKYSAF